MKAGAPFLFAQAAGTADPSQAGRAAPGTPTSDDRSTAFRSVQGGNVLQSGERLLVEAYAAIWLLLFAMLFLSWRRQKRMDRRIDSLEQAVARVRDAEAAADAKGEGKA